jgi:hypothetical protein
MSARRGSVSSQVAGIATIPCAAPSSAPAMHATESESPRMRAAFSTALPRLEDQRSAAATEHA